MGGMAAVWDLQQQQIEQGDAGKPPTGGVGSGEDCRGVEEVLRWGWEGRREEFDGSRVT